MVKKNHSKNRQNLVKITCEGEAKFICEVNVENLKQKSQINHYHQNIQENEKN